MTKVFVGMDEIGMPPLRVFSSVVKAEKWAETHPTFFYEVFEVQ